MNNPKLKLYGLLLLFSTLVTAQNSTEVFFGFNQDKLNNEAKVRLDYWIATHKNIQINRLSGYCDSIGNTLYNTDLALRRIQSIQQQLRKNNSSISNDIKLEPYGEDFNQSSILAKNRKVTIYYSSLDTVRESQQPKKAETATITKPEIVTPSLEKQFKKAKKGDLIKLQNINFIFNSEKIMPDSEHVLLELEQVLVDNPKLKIEIQGHICCNPNPNDTKLSYRRAKYIMDWLLNKDIDLNRLSFTGFGSSKPIYPIPEKNYQEEVANRRVEILIVENK